MSTRDSYCINALPTQKSLDELRELQVEMIDRFGLLPDYARNLFETTRLKLLVMPIGISKIEVGNKGGQLVFKDQPQIDTAKLIQLIQTHPQTYKLDGEKRLRFNLAMEGVQQKIDTVLGLIETLALKQAA